MARSGQRQLDAASAAVTEMGGKVAKKLGDGLMATRNGRRRIPFSQWAFTDSSRN
jgi:hypothetical protein